MSDEIAVYSPRVARHTEKHSPFAINFAIPCGTPGLKFLCRESFDLRRSRFDHPLGSRFEEMDCVVFFDDVLVPWERVFVLGDVDLINGTALTTHSAAHTAHQGAAKNLAKCEFVLGVALLMTQTLGNAHLPHSEERLAELIMYTELQRACIRSAEADATPDEWGVMCPVPLQIELTRNLFMTAYPRMAEILQLHGSSSFMITPTEADFATPLAPAIEHYLATEGSGARDRVKLFRLAWDIAGSSFGSRQVLYERFFASDPLTRARFLGAIYPKQEVMKRVEDFLARSDDGSTGPGGPRWRRVPGRAPAGAPSGRAVVAVRAEGAASEPPPIQLIVTRPPSGDGGSSSPRPPRVTATGEPCRRARG